MALKLRQVAVLFDNNQENHTVFVIDLSVLSFSHSSSEVGPKCCSVDMQTTVAEEIWKSASVGQGLTITWSSSIVLWECFYEQFGHLGKKKLYVLYFYNLAI